MNYRLTTFITLIALSATGPALAASSSCETFASDMSKHVVDVFHDKDMPEDKKITTLTNLFETAVDTDWIGRFVLGRYWKAATPGQQKEYLSVYKDYVANAYVSKFHDDNGLSVDAIKITSLTNTQPGQYAAQSLIIRKGEEDVHVDYLLNQSDDFCHIHDIKVEGVSLLVSQRSEFQSLAERSGIRGVIAAMKKQLSV